MPGVQDGGPQQPGALNPPGQCAAEHEALCCAWDGGSHRDQHAQLASIATRCCRSAISSSAISRAAPSPLRIGKSGSVTWPRQKTFCCGKARMSCCSTKTWLRGSSMLTTATVIAAPCTLRSLDASASEGRLARHRVHHRVVNEASTNAGGTPASSLRIARGPSTSTSLEDVVSDACAPAFQRATSTSEATSAGA
eukprot:scaffold14682_cov124-Isochrysis_galbana.AAC.11